MFQRGWEVIRIDNDERFKDVPCTTIADVMSLTPDDLPDADLILASPPCNCFSRMTIRYYWENKRPKNDKARFAVELVKHTVSLIHAKKPKFWVLENPVGMMIYVLGRPSARTWWGAWYSEKDVEIAKLDEPPLKETHLWGLLPFIDWPPKPTHYARINRKSKDRQKGIQGIKDSAISAKIPFKFSEALAIAIEEGLGGQQSLLEHVF